MHLHHNHDASGLTDLLPVIHQLYILSHYPIHLFRDRVPVYSSCKTAKSSFPHAKDTSHTGVKGALDSGTENASHAGTENASHADTGVTADARDTAYQAENPFLCDPALAARLLAQTKRDPFVFSEESPFFYGIQAFPGNLACIVGPLASVKPDRQQLHAYMRRHQMKDYQNFYIHTGTAAQATTLLQLIGYLLTGSTCGSLSIPQHYPYPQWNAENENPASREQQDFLLQSYQMSRNDEETVHTPYKMEEMMLACIRDGDYEKLKKLFAGSSGHYSMGTMAHSPLKQTEYGAVIGVSLMARAAITGGVNPYDAYDMNDLYLQRISVARSEQEFQQILTDSFLGYIGAVRRAKAGENRSVHIETCKTYISRHLNQPFTRDDLARHTGLHPSYLSQLFARQEGVTLKRYILSERVRAAENMLKYSDYSIAQIAEYLCLGTQSRFGSTFKAFTGMTPSQFRKKNRQFR